MLKSRKMYLIVTVLLVVSLVVSSSASATNADYQNVGIGGDSLIGENNVFTEGQTVRAQSNSVKLTASRHISWTLNNITATFSGVGIYDNDVFVADVSGLVSGTTYYQVPSGTAHTITLKHGAVVLASCTG